MEDETIHYDKQDKIPFVDELVEEKPIELSLKEKLIKVLEEDPGVTKIAENPWLHDVWVRKLKELVT